MLGANHYTCNQRLPGDQPIQDARSDDLLPLQHALKICQICSKAEHRDLADQQALVSSKLPAMDLYAGGGGSVLGAADHFDVVAAVDYNSIEYTTLQSNFPEMRVYCGSMRHHLDRTKRIQAGQFVNDRFDRRDDGLPIQHRVRLAKLPDLGSIAVLTAGPPCQAFTGANTAPRSNDERINELWNTLDELERLQAPFLVLENVPGMKRNRTDVGDTFDMDTSSVRNFAAAAVKRLVSMKYCKNTCFTILADEDSYQVRLALLNSRAYGSPQNRRRLFILAARADVPLPNFPEPTHADPETPTTMFSLEENEGHNGFYMGKGTTPGTGPRPAITIDEAISDLPCKLSSIRQSSS